MRSEIKNNFLTDRGGNPMGGDTLGIGIEIRWQNGIVSEKDHNGAFVEDVIEAAIDRLKFFQGSKFSCRENALALTKLEEAQMWLERRTRNREAQGVEDSYEVHRS